MTIIFKSMKLVRVLVITLMFVSLSCSTLGADKITRNIGHRVGAGKGEIHSTLPENSLLALKVALLGDGKEDTLPIQFRPNFVYLEFDVQETRDGELVLFHDTKLERLFPLEGENRIKMDRLALEVGKGLGKKIKMTDLEISHLTVGQLKSLDLGGFPGEKIPTLKEFLDACLAYGLIKPLVLEIKSIRSDLARERLIEQLANFRDRWISRTKVVFESGYDLSPDGVSFMSFGSKFKKSFGKKKSKARNHWCSYMKMYNFHKVYRSMMHKSNLCKD